MLSYRIIKMVVLDVFEVRTMSVLSPDWKLRPGSAKLRARIGEPSQARVFAGTFSGPHPSTTGLLSTSAVQGETTQPCSI